MITLADIEKTHWYKTLPRQIQLLVHRFPPVASVRIRATSIMGYVYSWSLDNTVTLVIDPDAIDNKYIDTTLDVIHESRGHRGEDLKFLRENPLSIGLKLAKKMLDASDNAVICNQCDKPKVPGYLCENGSHNCFGDHIEEACAYHGGLCCECANKINKTH